MNRFLGGGGEMVMNWLNSCDLTAVMSSESLAGQSFKLDTAGAIPDMATSVCETLMPIAWGLLMVYFCMDLMQKASTENFNFQQMLGPFLKLIAGVALVSKTPDLTEALAKFANGLTEMVTFTTTEANPLLDQLDPGGNGYIAVKFGNSINEISGISGSAAEKNLKMNFIPAVYCCVLTLPYWVIAQLTTLFLFFMSFTREVEFFARCAFLPISCADIGKDGMNSGGVRYIKKIMAIGAQGVIIAAMLSAASVVLNRQIAIGVDGDNMTGMGMVRVVAMGITIVGGLGLSKTLANDAFGV